MGTYAYYERAGLEVPVRVGVHGWAWENHPNNPTPNISQPYLTHPNQLANHIFFSLHSLLTLFYLQPPYSNQGYQCSQAEAGRQCRTWGNVRVLGKGGHGVEYAYARNGTTSADLLLHSGSATD